MRFLLILIFLFSAGMNADSDDPCSIYKNQRKCSSPEAERNKCRWLRAKELCKSEDILSKEIEEQKKGYPATEDETEDTVKKDKKKGK